jgi:Leucine-rich repeat (LRR) protein
VFFVYLTHSELPEAIGRCISLQKLFLAHNLLTALPLSVYGGGTFPHATFVDSQLTGTENYVEPTEEDETLPEEGAILTHTYTHRERERERNNSHFCRSLPVAGTRPLPQQIRVSSGGVLPAEQSSKSELLLHWPHSVSCWNGDDNQRQLNAMCNLLTELSPSIEWLYNLTELNVAFNQLQSLPEQYLFFRHILA